MAAPFQPWERNSTVTWFYHPDFAEYTPQARQSLGLCILRKVWSRIWCDGPSETRDAAILRLECAMLQFPKSLRRR